MRLPFRFPLPLLLAVPIGLALVIVVAAMSFWIGGSDDDDRGASQALKSTDFVTGIPSPAGMTFGLGGLLITSLGTGQTDGSVYLARQGDDKDKAESLQKLVERLPSGRPIALLPFLPFSGPTAVALEGQSIVIVVGGERETGPRVFRAPLQAGAASDVFADIGAFWRREAPAGSIISVPFGAVRDADGSLFVSDSRAGALLRVTARGAVSIYSRFDPIAPPEGEPFAALPTGMALGPDGALYVALFGGEPYQAGRSRIYRLQDRSGDGDAADGGERTIVADGLSLCIGLAFGPDGRLYALEYAATLDIGAKGRLWRLGDQKSELLADDLVTPMALAIDEQGNVYVSERDAGKVRLFRGLASPPKLKQ